MEGGSEPPRATSLSGGPAPSLGRRVAPWPSWLHTPIPVSHMGLQAYSQGCVTGPAVNYCIPTQFRCRLLTTVGWCQEWSLWSQNHEGGAPRMDQHPDGRDPESTLPLPPGGDTGKRRRPHQTLNLPAPLLSMSSLQSWEKRRSVVQLPSLWCITITAQRD